jgi:hypothetical protein
MTCTTNGPSLELLQVSAPNVCEGSEWVLVDQNALAQQVARIAVGQYHHVRKILAGFGDSPAVVVQAAKNDAIALLTVKPGDKPWHRDGWLFQTVSWIAAHLEGGVAIRAPHLIKAHKGFDGLKLELSAAGKVTAVVIFEDKATKQPRDTICGKVWPAIARIEQGERSNELVQEVSALLETQMRSFPDLDVDAAIQEIAWKEARRYRVAITVNEPHTNAESRISLFKDFDIYVPGDSGRRLGETMHVPDLRPWMQAFASLVISKIKDLPDHV